MAHGIQVKIFTFVSIVTCISNYPLLQYIHALFYNVQFNVAFMKTITDILMFYIFFAVKLRGGEWEGFPYPEWDDPDT